PRSAYGQALNTMSDDAKSESNTAPQFRRAFRDAIIDARLSNDLDDKKARELLDVLTGSKLENAQSEEVYQQSLNWSFLGAGVMLTLLGLAWLGLFLATDV
ncbi:MAG: hypothetical protein P1V97_24180, partial [Planctomycetota bacterium]|nr:hypothetical protein [Planctomycetota bacterium]